jgi:hypothetical protein
MGLIFPLWSGVLPLALEEFAEGNEHDAGYGRWVRLGCHDGFDGFPEVAVGYAESYLPDVRVLNAPAFGGRIGPRVVSLVVAGTEGANPVTFGREQVIPDGDGQVDLVIERLVFAPGMRPDPFRRVVARSDVDDLLVFDEEVEAGAVGGQVSSQ